MDRALAIVEKSILYVLMTLMTIVLILATLDLIWTLALALSTPPFLILALDKLLDVFAMFLLVLVGLELLDTLRAYFREHVVHAEIVLLAAMIAVARKAITLDFKQLDPLVPFAISALIIALAGAYALLKRAGLSAPPESHT
jgi:uncharacterized membrane protein (DUF373 family)